MKRTFHFNSRIFKVYLNYLDNTVTGKPEIEEDQTTILNKPPIAKNLPASLPKSNPSVSHESLVARPVTVSITSNESRGLSSNVSVPFLNQTLQLPPDINGSAQEQPGIILSRDLDSQKLIRPVLGRDDVFQTHRAGFPSGVSSGFELPTERQPIEYEKANLISENFKFATEAPGFSTYGDSHQHGFSLRPVTGTLQPEGVDVTQSLEEDIFLRNVSGSTPKAEETPAVSDPVEEATGDEDTPPPGSLKNIKSVVRRKKEERNNTKPPSGKQRELKRGSPKVLPRSTTPGGRARKIEDTKGRFRKDRGQKISSGDDKNIVADDRFGWNYKARVNTSHEKKGITSKNEKVKHLLSTVINITCWFHL